jgi:uncharacterized protein YjbJ (UPF0337 family)
MNKDILSGNWKQLKGLIKQQWGKLTDDDIDRIEGSWDKLTGALQERYGIERQEAESRIDEYLKEVETVINKV